MANLKMRLRLLPKNLLQICAHKSKSLASKKIVPQANTTSLSKKNYSTTSYTLQKVKNGNQQIIGDDMKAALNNGVDNSSSLFAEQITTLDITNYQLWSSQQVCSLLCLPEADGGTSLPVSDVAHLYKTNFNGFFLNHTIQTIQAKDEFFAIDTLSKLLPNVPRYVIPTVVFWVVHSFMSNLSSKTNFQVSLKQFDDILKFDDILSLLNKFPPRKHPKPLVQSHIFVPFKTTPEFVDKVSECFSDLEKANDKQNIFIPFLACGPGTGKSRTLQEIFPLTKQGQKFKNNSITLLITFGNGDSIDALESHDYEKALCMRILHSYLDVPYTYSDFRGMYWKDINTCSFERVLTAITHNFKTNNNLQLYEKVYIYLGIDEFTELHTLSYGLETFLHGVISLVGSFISSSRNKTISLLPIFAGLDYAAFTVSSSHSQYGSVYFTPYRYTSEDITSIIEQHIPFPNIRSSPQLWKCLTFINRHARFLESFLEKLKRQDLENLKTIEDISNAILSSYNSANNNFKESYKNFMLKPDVAKLLLAYVMTEQIIPSFETEITPNGPTFKELEDRGYIRLISRYDNQFKCTSPLPILEKCSILLKESIFPQFFSLLKNPITVDRDFEKFNAYFDIMLNECFIYLGYSEMSIKERCRGILVNQNFVLNLNSFPTSLEEKKLSEINVNSIPNKTIVQFTSNNTNYRCCNVIANNEVYTLLWQEKGSKTSYRNFTTTELMEIINNLFTQQKSLAVVVTIRPVSTVQLLTKGQQNTNIALIGREVLEDYYGSFIFQVYFCNNMVIPFPINQTFTDPNHVKKHVYNLAFLLGIDNRRAETLYNQIADGHYIKELKDLDSVKNPYVKLSADLFNFTLPLNPITCASNPPKLRKSKTPKKSSLFIEKYL